jgi:glucans biosynthesis protein C
VLWNRLGCDYWGYLACAGFVRRKLLQTNNSSPQRGDQDRRDLKMSKTSQALKNLRALAILMVVSFHGTLAYLTSQPAAQQPFDLPPYAWIATPILDKQRWLGFDLYDAFQYLTLMPFMFFLSGIFVWPSLSRNGAWKFFHARLLRIGLPFVLGEYLLMPLAYYPVYSVTADDPSWFAFWNHLVALPFWPSGPLWFLWLLLAFDAAAAFLYRIVPSFGRALGLWSASAGKRPGRYFVVLVAVSALAYVPLALVFGASQWKNFGPFALQPDRILLYVVYFFAGVGVGANGYDRGLLGIDAALVRRWYLWFIASAATFLLWMVSMAASFYGYGSTVVDIGAYLAVVLAVASACFCFNAVFLRFATGRVPIVDSLAENAYAIYLVHYVFVVWLQYALLSVVWPAIVKGIIVFSGTLVLSWATAVGSTRLASNVRVLRAKSFG